MRNNVDLYISDERVELFDFESINVVDKIQDVRDIKNVFTPYSREFTVPASKHNNRIFRHYYNQNVVNGFDARFKISAEIRINSITYKKGRVSLIGASLKNDIPYNYKLVFYSKTVDLNTILGNDMLSDLQNDYIRQFSFDYSATNIYNGLTAGYYLSGGNLVSTGTVDNENSPRDVIVPFISTNNFYFYDSDNNGVSPVGDDTESRNVSSTASYSISARYIKEGFRYEILTVGTTDYTALGAASNTVGVNFIASADGDSDTGSGRVYTGRGLYYKDLRPAIRLPILIEAINQQYEDINLTGDFIDSTNEVFNRMYLYLQKENGLYEPFGSGESSLSTATLSSGVDLRPPASYMDIDGDLYNYVELKIKTTPLLSTDVYNVKIVDGDTGVIFFDELAYGEYSRTITLKNTNVFGDDKEWDNIKVYVDNVESTTVDVLYTQFNYVFFEGYYDETNDFILDDTSTYTETITVDTTYNIYDNMPEYKVINFLTDLFKMFNLTAYVDDDGSIVIQTLDDFYANGNVVDLTNFIDTSKKEVTKNNLYSQIGFEFEEASTFAVTNSNNITGDIFGNEKIDNTNNDLDLYNILAFDGGTYDISVGLEKVMYERMTDQSDAETNTNVGWGWLVDEDQEPTLTKPFFFYSFYEDLTTGTPTAMGWDSGTTFSSFTSYYRPSNSLTEGTTLGQSLNFGAEFDEYQPNAINTESLFENYWKELILSIYDKQSRIVKVSGYLPTSILTSIRLNDTVVIRNNKYRINSIDVDITTGKAAFELLSII